MPDTVGSGHRGRKSAVDERTHQADRSTTVPDVRIAKGGTVAHDSVLRRVSVYAGVVHVDVALPAAVPIAALMPSIIDIVASRGYRPDRVTAAPYRLTPPCGAALDTSMTLAQQGIRDGAVLVVTSWDSAPPAPPVDDVADAVSRTMGSQTHPATSRDIRRYLALWATGLAGAAGFLAVPGGPGAPNVLLAAAAVAAVSVLALRRSGRADVALTAVWQVAVVVAVAAAPAMIGDVPLQVIGAVAAASCVGVLQVSARVAVVAAGLSRRVGVDAATPPDDLDALARRAHRILTGLVVASSAAVTLGAIGTAIGVHTTGAPRYGGAVFAAVAGAVLGLRAPSHTDRYQVLALIAGASVALSASWVAVAVTAPPHRLWATAAAAAAIAAALCGARAPVSPVVHRAVETLEYLALVAITPLTCWICGLFGAARALDLA